MIELRALGILLMTKCSNTRLSVKPGRKAAGGEIRSANAGMSSDKECERHSRRKSKGSCLKLI